MRPLRLLLLLIIKAVALAPKYEVALRLPPEGLVAGEETQIEFRVSDTLPIIRARIEAEIDMPAMPGMPKVIETAHPEGVPGDYGVHPTFPHGGEYRLRLHIVPLEGEPASAEFLLNVQDAGTVPAKKTPPRFRLEIASEPKTPKAGEPAKLRLIVRERENPRAIYSGFDIVHEKPMHLILVSKELDGFRHEHPELTPDGSFALAHKFTRAGEHHVFADVAPKGAGSQILFAKLKVGGKTEALTKASLSLKANCGATTVQIVPPENPIETNKTKSVAVAFRNTADDQPVLDLENYLGAKAHLILIHEDAVTFVHSHPDDRQTSTSSGGIVPFLVRLPKPGIYRAWLQFIRAGVLNTAELEIEGAIRK
jgi:hypothetical protein